MSRTTKAQLEKENGELRSQLAPIRSAAKMLLSQAIIREYDAREKGQSIIEVKLHDNTTASEYAKVVLG